MGNTIEHLGFLFLAVGDNAMKATGETPRAAALAFLAKNPTKRKPFNVHLVQSAKDSSGFLYRYYWGGLAWKDVTRKTAPTLPEQGAQGTDRAAFEARIATAGFVFSVYHNGGA